MTQSELKRKMESLISTYFSGATVTWGKVKAVSPNEPQVVLNTLPVTRPYHPITYDVHGVPINCMPSKTVFQVDLYTQGAPTKNSPGVRAAHENTAVNDMTGFVNFLYSQYVDLWTLRNDVSILVNQVHDLTERVNDAAWGYRAMVELELGFTENAVGYTGLNYENGMAYWGNGAPKYDANGNPLYPDGNPIPPELDEAGNPIPWPPPRFNPSPSGGGSQDLADQFTGWFEQVAGPEDVSPTPEDISPSE
jgi:hypothetical protein